MFPEGKFQMASSENRIRGTRRRLLVGAVALGAATLGLTSCGFAMGTPTDRSPSDTRVVECRSGIVTQGDTDTSSLSVTKVPAGETPDVPGGCTVQTG